MDTVRRTRLLAPLLVLAGLMLPVPSWAYHVVVQQGGGGDATTFQGGLDLLSAQFPVGRMDTLIVMPGNYDETITIATCFLSLDPVTIIAPGGFAQTRIREIRFDTFACSPISFTGLSIGLPVKGPNRALWTYCRFESGYDDNHYPQSYEGCEFHGRVVLAGTGYGPDFIHDCRFVRATLDLNEGPGDGGMELTRCTFIGPADTAMINRSTPTNNTYITNSTFLGCGYGIVQAADYLGGLIVQQCGFDDIAKDAIHYSSDIAYAYDIYEPPPIGVYRSFFRNCGAAVRWHSTIAPSLYLQADTVETTRGPGIVADVGACGIDGLMLSRCGGNGVQLTVHLRGGVYSEPIDVRNATCADNAGVGLIVRDTIAADYAAGIRVTNCVLCGNGAAGLSCQGKIRDIAGNVAHHNAGPGLDLSLAGATDTARITLNSCVLNGGTGLRLGGESSQFPTTVENNLSAFNDGMGFDVASAFSGAVTHNDAWSNARDGGLAEGSPNLSLDPGLCDPLVGDNHLQRASPCASTGPYGQIGALGVGCDASKIVVDVFPNQPSRPLPDRGKVPVPAAVLGTRVLDVATLDPLSARLGNAAPFTAGPLLHQASISDVNGDGRADLVLWFDAVGIGDVPSDGRLPLTIATTSGLAEAGNDVVSEVGGLTAGGRHELRRLAIENERVAFQVSGTRFDRGTGRASVDLTVPAPGLVLIEMFDVSGRRVARHEMIAARSGAQTIELAAERQLSSGIYLVRVTRAGVALKGRVVLVR
jgi:hypothetical protein